MTFKKQSTLQKEVSFQGKALFNGAEVSVKLIPASPGTGIIFRRVDLPGHPEIAAQTENVTEAVRTTRLGHPEIAHASVQTVEHFMAAVFAQGVHNLIVEITGPEMPIFDGSSLPFVEILETAGLEEQDATQPVYVLEEPCFISRGDAHIIALPADDFCVSYTLHYPQSPYLRSQYFSSAITSHSFKGELAPCRTFALYEEVIPLIQKGILKNAALEHGIVIDGERVLNADGVRFPDEMVRHKALDLIGDIALLGWELRVHLMGIKTGHAANHAIAKELRKSLRKQ